MKRTLSMTLRIHTKTMITFSDPSIKEYADMVILAQNIAKETYSETDLLICEQYGPGPFDIEWKVIRFEHDGTMHKSWEEDEE